MKSAMYCPVCRCLAERACSLLNRADIIIAIAAFSWHRFSVRFSCELKADFMISGDAKARMAQAHSSDLRSLVIEVATSGTNPTPNE